MRVLVTGCRGTVGTPLRSALHDRGNDVVCWNRDEAHPLDRDAVAWRVRSAAPDVLVHLAIASFPTGVDNEGWRVNVDWTDQLGQLAVEHGFKMLFVSTALVFTNAARGPFTVDAAPDASDGYGGHKRAAEERVRNVCPAAVIARLGWQIATEPGSNNVLEHLEARSREQGVVPASRRWLPACSFLDDTVRALLWLTQQPAGTYHVDSNRDASFYDIARALSRRHGDRWRIEPTDDYVYDQRLVDARVPMPTLRERLPELDQLD